MQDKLLQEDYGYNYCSYNTVLLMVFKLNFAQRSKNNTHLTLGGGILESDEGRGIPVPAGLGRADIAAPAGPAAPDAPVVRVRIIGGLSPEPPRAVGRDT